MDEITTILRVRVYEPIRAYAGIEYYPTEDWSYVLFRDQLRMVPTVGLS